MAGHRLVVWYNTRCPVCDAGIDWQRNELLAAVRTGAISFKDINDWPDVLASYGASVDDLHRRPGICRSPGTNGRGIGDANDRVFCGIAIRMLCRSHPRPHLRGIKRP